MIDLGGELRRAREEQEISLAEAEKATRIKASYLKALEVNDWAAMPTDVQARGFLRNYAVYLGLDPDDVMSRFSQVARSGDVSFPTPPAKSSPVPTTGEDGAVFRPRDIDIDSVGGLPTWLSSDIVLGVALALVVVIVGFGIVRFTLNRINQEPADPTARPAITPLVTNISSESGAATAAPRDDATLPAITPTFDASSGSVTLDLEATEHVWVRVTVDGARVLEGILAPGAPQNWQGAQQIVLETANAAGLLAVVNGQPQGSLGERGQAVVLAWGPTGQIDVTPAASP
jgi:cytoskeleton protein RodZ